VVRQQGGCNLGNHFGFVNVYNCKGSAECVWRHLSRQSKGAADHYVVNESLLVALLAVFPIFSSRAFVILLRIQK